MANRPLLCNFSREIFRGLNNLKPHLSRPGTFIRDTNFVQPSSILDATSAHSLIRHSPGTVSFFIQATPSLPRLVRASRCVLKVRRARARFFFQNSSFPLCGAGAVVLRLLGALCFVSRWRALLPPTPVVLFEGTWADGAPLQATSVPPCLLPRKQLALGNSPLPAGSPARRR